MRSDLVLSVALVALYSSSAIAGPIDFLRRSTSLENVRRGGPGGGGSDRRPGGNRGDRIIKVLGNLGAGGPKGNAGPSGEGAIAPPPVDLGPGAPPAPPLGTGVAPPPEPPLGTGIAPPLGTGVAPPPALETAPPPFANETANVPPQAEAPATTCAICTACPTAQTLTVTVTETIAAGGAPTEAPIASPPVEGNQPPVASPPPEASQPPPANPPGEAQPEPLPTEVLTTVAPSPLDPATAGATVVTITSSALAPAEVVAGEPAAVTEPALPPAAGGINAGIGGIGGSNGNSGTINNIQIIVIQLTQQGAVQTITSTVDGVPVTETVTLPPTTVLSTMTLTEGSAATDTGSVLPPGAEVVSNVTVPAPPEVKPPPYALLNETATVADPALATGVLPPPGAVGTGVLPPPGAIETGAPPPPPAGVHPPAGAIETGVLPPPGAIESGAVVPPPPAAAPTETVSGVIPPPGAIETGTALPTPPIAAPPTQGAHPPAPPPPPQVHKARAPGWY